MAYIAYRSPAVAAVVAADYKIADAAYASSAKDPKAYAIYLAALEAANAPYRAADAAATAVYFAAHPDELQYAPYPDEQ